MTFADLLSGADRVALQHLGDSVGYVSGDGRAVSVRGIFDAAYVKADAGQAGVSSVGPAVFLRLADLPSNPGEDGAAAITVGGVEYRVREAQPDGHGGILLQLQRA